MVVFWMEIRSSPKMNLLLNTVERPVIPLSKSFRMGLNEFLNASIYRQIMSVPCIWPDCFLHHQEIWEALSGSSTLVYFGDFPSLHFLKENSILWRFRCLSIKYYLMTLLSFHCGRQISASEMQQGAKSLVCVKFCIEPNCSHYTFTAPVQKI